MRADFEDLDLPIDFADDCGIANAPWKPIIQSFLKALLS
jgi:hypothetical protein